MRPFRTRLIFENFRKINFSSMDSRFEHRPDVKSLFESHEKISIQLETLKLGTGREGVSY